MKTFIKYVSALFGIFLAVSIISGIVGVTVAVIENVSGMTFTDTDIKEEGGAAASGWDGKSEERTDAEYVFENCRELKELDLEITAERLTVISGDELKVEFKNVPKDYECSFENGVLKVSYDAAVTINIIGIFNPSGCSTGANSDGEIIVTLPEGTELEVFDLDSGLGQIQLNDIVSKSTEIDSGTGSVSAENCDFGITNLDLGTGRVLFTDVTLADTKIDGGTGSISISGNFTGNTDIDAGTGSVTLLINGNSDEYEIRGDGGSSFTVQEIIQGKTNRIPLECLEGYDFYYKGGKADKTITVDCGTGSVRITFEE